MEAWHILVILGILAFVVEIFTAGFVAGSIGIGFFLAALGNYLGLELQWQILMFALGIALSFFLIRPVMKKIGGNKYYQETNRDAIIGKEGRVTEEINTTNDTGRVSIDGDDWKAVSNDGNIIISGTPVKVTDIDSIVLIVKPIKK